MDTNHRTVIGTYIMAGIIAVTLSACSKQNWYQGAQSAQTARCLQEPQAEYNDCNRQTSQSYNEYDKNREDLIKENTVTVPEKE